MSIRFSEKDLRQIKARGLTESIAQAQIARLINGFPPVCLNRPCVIGDGILQIPPEAFNLLLFLHERAAHEGRLMKFVPASGAATRMFERLQKLAARERIDFGESPQNDDPINAFGGEFFTKLTYFPFYQQLSKLISRNGKDLKSLIKKGNYKAILQSLLTSEGMNFSQMPKGLIPFHAYPDHVRSPFEEQLAEAIDQCSDVTGLARAHFTVALNQLTVVQNFLANTKARFLADSQRLELSFSIQEPSTDALALDEKKQPYRLKDGSLLFRPGGHGALLGNLQALKGDIVFIKNIDNVAPAWFDSQTSLYKKLLCGLLVDIERQIFDSLLLLEDPSPDPYDLNRIYTFVFVYLCRVPPMRWRNQTPEIKRKFLIDALNRPLRVCGMVRNQGEPGGGPFWVEHPDRHLSLQIVEKGQIDASDAGQLDIFQNSTHFNPVDLVCSLRNYRGEQFDLLRFRDEETGMTSQKSKDGEVLTALEHPGLWNGGMAGWNTIFVEVPLTTFNPVKTVNDLLRPEHQPQGIQRK